MTSLDLYRPVAALRRARVLPRGLGLAAGAAVSLLMWAGLIRLAMLVFGG